MIETEKHGVPTILVVTEQFADLARVVARAKGMSALRFVVVPHPFATLDHDVIRSLAKQKAHEFVELIELGRSSDQVASA